MADAQTRNSPKLEMNDGREIPALGFGTYQLDDAEPAVHDAIALGYSLVDTAAIYGNEKGVGAGLSGADDIFLTTKVWNDDHGEAKTRAAVEKSLSRLGRDHVDLLLIHWPCPNQGLFVETWKTFVALREEGKTRSIGVSNFLPDHLKQIVDATGVAPALNQIELHPYFQQSDLAVANAEHGVLTQCWTPLGRGKPFDDAELKRIAKAHDVSVAAVILAWQIARGFSTIPKAASEAHRKSNLAALDVALSQEDIAAIDALDRGEEERIGPHPQSFG